MERALGWALLISLFAGCSTAVTVRGDVLKPAQVPVRAFPRIFVTSGDDTESQQMALAVARHLARGRSTVDRLDRAVIARLRAEGRIERATVVIELATTFSRHASSGWLGPTDCGPAGCLDAARNFRDEPILRARVIVTVQDGPSGRALQRVELMEEGSGSDATALRARVLERLSQRTLALVDQRIEQVPVRLYPLDLPAVRRAVEAIEEGRWADGRQILEKFVRDERFRSLPRDQRALVLYNLGQARRFDRTLPPEQRFRAAGRALRAAVRLMPVPSYAQAIAELEQHRQNRAMVREQQEAMAHNFGLGRRSEDHSPPPPEHYRR